MENEIRVHKSGEFTVMSNHHLRDSEMSLKAKGLLTIMLSLPKEWDYSVAGLQTLSKDGKDSTTNALLELETLGYLTRTKQTTEAGRFNGYRYDIYEKPQTEKPLTGNPPTDNPQQYNIKQTNIEKSNIKEIKKERKTFDGLIEKYITETGAGEEVRELLGEWLKVRKAKRSAMTDRAIELNLNKLDEIARESNLTVAEYLKEVICRGWQAFFPIKTYNTKQEQAGGIMDDFNTFNEEFAGV